MRHTIVALSISLVIGTVVAAEPAQRTLTFEDRVQAQVQIDAVYAAALSGPVAEPTAARQRAEAKVREALKQSIVLATGWKTPITRDALQREVERIARSTGNPDRLRALYSALANDSFLIEEALARPPLVDRLLGNFFAYDARIHGQVRAEAEALRTAMLQNPTITDLGRATRTEHELKRSDQPAVRDAFDRALRDLPKSIGVPGDIHEERTAFTFDVALKLDPAVVRFARYSVPKVGWKTWWGSAAAAIDDAAVRAAAAAPTPGASAPPNLAPAGASCDPGGTWNNGLLGLLPSPRFGHSMIWTGTEIVVWGGYDWVATLNSGGRYDPLTDSWRMMSIVAAPSPRHSHQAVWTGSTMIVWGGVYQTQHNGQYLPLGDGGSYNPSTDSWSPMSSVSAPPAAFGYTSVWTGTEMIVWNGTVGGRYNPATNTWSPVSAVGAPVGGGVVWSGTEMIVWNGTAGGRYNPVTNTWRPMSATGGPSSPALVWTGSEVIAWSGGYPGDGGLYDPATDSWRPMSPNTGFSYGWTPAIWTGTEMIVVGDLTRPDPHRKYNPTTDTWTDANMTNAPENQGSAAVWTGTSLIVWGGGSPASGAVSIGGRYDPAADTWTPTSTNRAPATGGHDLGRVGALWTPVGMLTWGQYGTPTGVDRYDPTLDVWISVDAPVSGQAICTGPEVIWWNQTSWSRLDLQTGTWRPASTNNAPGSGATVWTGTRMLVWTGTDGGRYDPVSDTWLPISTAGAASGGSVVWTGGRMVVWDNTGNTGGRYDPTNNNWSPMSALGAPSVSDGFSVVSTNQEMIVWGGYTNAGARYDPTTDIWRLTSLTGAPSPRRWHGAVWTGREMVVWGGEDVDNFVVGTGGRYDPVNDRWTGVSVDGAPAARVSHSLVWTGQVVLVWGGDIYPDNAAPLNVGGRLFLGQIYDNDGDGYSVCEGDCDDTHASVHPGASEICNGMDDNCDGQVDEGGNALCDDGNACTVGEACEGGTCRSGVPVVCVPLDQCHLTGTCNPASGTCSNPAKPNGSACNDGNLCTTGDVCTSGSCGGASHLNEPHPRTVGYYKRLCNGSHTGDALTAADAACVADSTATFDTHTVADLCAIISRHDGGDDDHDDHDGYGSGRHVTYCDKARAELVALALNRCRARVCDAQEIDSACAGNSSRTVGQSFTAVDGILSTASPSNGACKGARCMAKEINNGRAFEIDDVHCDRGDFRHRGGIMCHWSVPLYNDDTLAPRSYEIWRRPHGAGAFTKVATVTTTSYTATDPVSNFDYDVIPVR